MSDYVVEHGVPIPENTERAANRKYPFRSMAIGDSFFVASELDERQIARNRMAASIRYVSMQTGAKFTVRNVDGGLRVWRIA